MHNPHLSYSRLTRYETCPLSYKLHYIDRQEAEPGIPLRFGKAIHAVLERLLQHTLDEEQEGPLSEKRALALYREAWAEEGLTGLELFAEGIGILKNFILEQGMVDPHDVLAVEKEFELQVGPFRVIGFIDRVDRVDDETLKIVDYKTNHALFTRDEVEASLQLSLYAIAAKHLWPWAKKIELEFWMLRHGVKQATTRTPEQLDAALDYVQTLGHAMEAATAFPARLNPNCVHCDHRHHCPAYAEALAGKRDFVCEDMGDLAAVAREREEVARLAKILSSRKGELEDILKAHLQDRDELVLAGMRYRMFRVTSLDYPLEPTLAVLGKATGLGREELLGKVATVDKKELDAMLKALGKRLDRPRVLLLKAELQAKASETHSTRFWASDAKEVA